MLSLKIDQVQLENYLESKKTIGTKDSLFFKKYIKNWLYIFMNHNYYPPYLYELLIATQPCLL